MFRPWFIAFVCLYSSMLGANTLTPTEIKIRDQINGQTNAQISLLERLVNINSGTANLQGVHEVGEILRPAFAALGFKTRWVEQPKHMQRAGTLIAERQGQQGKHILLIGHLDTVFAKDSKFNRFEKRKNSAKGPGVIDDKGGIVIILYALKALHAVGALDNTSITVVLTGDEESSGKPTSISRKALIDAARNMDVALDFEPAISLETATIARRGISNWWIDSHGNEAHSASIFQAHVGDGAIFEISRILNNMRTELKGEKYLTFNPGIILAGNKINYDDNNANGTAFGKQNVVAKRALASGDVRFIDEAQKNAFKLKMAKIVKQSLSGTHSSITFQDGIPPMPPTANNRKLLEKYSAASDSLGLGKVKPYDPAFRGAGDISYVAALVPANIAGLGAIGSSTHATGETIEFHSLATQTKRAAILIYRLTSGSR